MKIKTSIYFPILTLLALLTCSSQAMNRSNVRDAFIKILIHSCKKNLYIKNFKINRGELTRKIETTFDAHSLGKTKINFFTENAAIGYTIYNNDLCIDCITKEKYGFLNTLFVHENQRGLGFGKKLFKETIEMMRKHFPHIKKN